MRFAFCNKEWGKNKLEIWLQQSAEVFFCFVNSQRILCTRQKISFDLIDMVESINVYQTLGF